MFTLATTLVAVLAAPACSKSDGAPSRPRAPADAVPDNVGVGDGQISEGVFVGKRRQVRDVAAFSIAKTPTTVGQYRQCVSAGVCTAPELDSAFCSSDTFERARLDGHTYGLGDEDVPVTCVSFSQAAAYCQWVGGRLPSSVEWQSAARGPKVNRFAWGNSGPTCDHHWRVAFAGASGCCGGGCDEVKVGRVGQRNAGNSPAGLSDVLSTRAELVASDPDSVWSSCRDGRGCVATGRTPGAIDAFLPESAQQVAPAPSFRCAWGRSKS